MKNTKLKFAILALCTLALIPAVGTGCASGTAAVEAAAKWQGALANDQADLDVTETVNTPWGPQTLTLRRRGHPPVPSSPVHGTNAPLPSLGTLPATLTPTQ